MANIGQDLLNVPFAEMVEEVAGAITEAQLNLDRNTVEVLKVMGDETQAPVMLPSLEINDNGEIQDAEIETSMIGAGFQPTFYQFAETVIEVKMAMTATQETTTKSSTVPGNIRTKTGRTTRANIKVTPIDASYSNKYNYTQEGASTLRTRLVPVPPNAMIQKQIEMRAQYMQMKFAQQLEEVEAKLNE